MESSNPWVHRSKDGWQHQILVGPAGFNTGILDVEARSPDGRRWLGTVGTLADVQELLTKWQEDGECLNGAYFFVTDFVVVAESNENSIFAVMEHLASTGEIELAFDEADLDENSS